MRVFAFGVEPKTPVAAIAPGMGVHSASSIALARPPSTPSMTGGVGVEGDVYARVAQEFLDVLGVLACHKEYCSAGVAEIMEPDRWQVGLFQEGLEVTA